MIIQTGEYQSQLIEAFEADPRTADLPVARSLFTLAVLQDNFKCKRCGACCKKREITISAKELRRIYDHMHIKDQSLTMSKFRQRYVSRRVGDKFHLRSPCPFLEKGGCTIHETRPKMCRDFPFFGLSETSKANRDTMVITEICPDAVAFSKEMIAAIRRGERPQTP